MNTKSCNVLELKRRVFFGVSCPQQRALSSYPVCKTSFKCAFKHLLNPLSYYLCCFHFHFLCFVSTATKPWSFRLKVVLLDVHPAIFACIWIWMSLADSRLVCWQYGTSKASTHQRNALKRVVLIFIIAIDVLSLNCEVWLIICHSASLTIRSHEFEKLAESSGHKLKRNSVLGQLRWSTNSSHSFETQCICHASLLDRRIFWSPAYFRRLERFGLNLLFGWSAWLDFVLFSALLRN